MSLDKLHRGNRGEQFAVEFLTSNVFKIIDRNFRIRGGEIDIVAIETDQQTHERTLVFLEVKTRSQMISESPLKYLDTIKCERL